MKVQHSLSDAPNAGIDVWKDKRRSKRVQYCAVIPVTHGPTPVPSRTKFVPVETRDLSQNGMSFYSQTAPEEPTIVVQLGDDRDALYYSARVVRCEKDYDDPARRFIVGCEFLHQVR